MKNAMKKLLSLALVAMLLVSVVPMGAMASEWLPDNGGNASNDAGGIIQDEPRTLNGEDPGPGEGFAIPEGEGNNGESKSDADAGKVAATKDVSYKVVKPNGEVATGVLEDQDVNLSLKNILEKVYTVPSDCDVTYTLDGAASSSGVGLVNSSKDVAEVVFTVAKKDIYVKMILKEVGEVETTRKINTVLTLNEKTLSEFGVNLKITEGKKLDHFTINGQTYLPGATYTITEPVVIEAYQSLKGNNGSTDATEGTTTPSSEKITLQIKFGEGSPVSWTRTDTTKNGYATVSNLLTYWYNKGWDNEYKCIKAYSSNKKTDIGVNGTAYASDTVTVILVAKDDTSSKPTDPTKPTTPVAEYIDVIVNVDGATKVNTSVKAKSASIDQLLKNLVGDNWASVYKFDYWTEEGQPYKYANVNSVVAAGKRITINLVGGTSKHNTNKVMLHVFLNGNTSTVYASYNITGDLAQDYKVTYNEVKSYLMNRYKAKTDAGLDLDGLYYVTGNWVGNYFQDNKATTIDDLDWELEKGYVHINVMLNNATAKTSSNADTSNPKTGDDIYMTVTVMGLSAAALCAVYYISKKRAVR